MIKAAIVSEADDALEQAAQIIGQNEMVAGLQRFENGGALLDAAASEREHPDVVFLPIGRNVREQSLELARKLYEANRYLPLILLAKEASDFDQTILLEDIHVYGLLALPVEPAVLARYMEKLVQEQQGFERLSFKIRGSQYDVKSEEILFIESQGHTAMINTGLQHYRVYEKLSRLAERLPDTFMQSHKSYMVNMEKVVRMEQNSLILEDGTVIPISRARKKSIVSQYHHMQQDKRS